MLLCTFIPYLAKYRSRIVVSKFVAFQSNTVTYKYKNKKSHGKSSGIVA